MAQFKIAETDIGPEKVPCVLIFGGRRNAETRTRIQKAAGIRWPDAARIILWDAPDGKALGFDGPLELTPFFSSMTPERLRSLISGELEA
ncbi:MAG: hypothetical protein V4726_19305 [Verrucomicrobiota bacterium]